MFKSECCDAAPSKSHNIVWDNSRNTNVGRCSKCGEMTDFYNEEELNSLKKDLDSGKIQ